MQHSRLGGWLALLRVLPPAYFCTVLLCLLCVWPWPAAVSCASPARCPSASAVGLQVKLADVPVAVQEGPSGAGPAPANAGVGSPPAPRVLVRKRSDRMPSHRGGMMGPGVEGGYGMPGANGQYRCAAPSAGGLGTCCGFEHVCLGCLSVFCHQLASQCTGCLIACSCFAAHTGMVAFPSSRTHPPVLRLASCCNRPAGLFRRGRRNTTVHGRAFLGRVPAVPAASLEWVPAGRCPRRPLAAAPAAPAVRSMAAWPAAPPAAWAAWEAWRLPLVA